MRYLVGLLVLILALPELIVRLVLGTAWVALIVIITLLIGAPDGDDPFRPVPLKPSCLTIAEKLLRP